PRDLQLQIVLIRPEPGHFGIRVRLAGEVCRGGFRLLDRVLHGLEPNAPQRERMRMVRAVTGRRDPRVRRHGPLVDDDPVLARQARRLGELDVRLDADADDREIARKTLAARRLDRLHRRAARECGYDGAEANLYARVRVIPMVEGRTVRPDDATHHAVGRLAHGDVHAPARGDGGDLEADVA